MKDGIPGIYWTLRYVWSTLHVVLVVALIAFAAVYLMSEGRGAEMFDDFTSWSGDVHDTLANLIPFPWS